MNGAVFALAANVGVAMIFAGCFAAIALTYPHQRRALLFSASYIVGTMTPTSELLVHFSDYPDVFVATSFASFLGALLLIAAGLAEFHGRRPDWGVIAAIFVLGLAIRAIIWGGTRNSLPYELAYQFPFFVASTLVCVTVIRIGRMSPLYLTLGSLFGVIALHFLAKPLFAVVFGSGPTARDYAGSTYALFSQATTGILLIAAGMLVLLLVVQATVAQSQLEAETDPLAAIPNRRGFDRRAHRAMALAIRPTRPLSVVMFDLDRFKAINDSFGHAKGDEVITAFAALLRRSAPQSAVLGRIGGEEFAMMLEGTTAEGATLIAQAIRIAVSDLPIAGLPPVSVSGGVAEWNGEETLSELMRRADQASYRAKREGRDRICVAGNGQIAPVPGDNILAFAQRR